MVFKQCFKSNTSSPPFSAADGSEIVGDGRSRYRSGFTGMDKSLQRRLKALGFRPGADVEILRDVWPFPLHVRVGMTEVMVRRKDWKMYQIGRAHV